MKEVFIVDKSIGLETAERMAMKRLKELMYKYPFRSPVGWRRFAENPDKENDWTIEEGYGRLTSSVFAAKRYEYYFCFLLY